jgi:alkane 1-monooxygenase
MRKLLPFTMIWIAVLTLLIGVWVGGIAMFLTPVVIFVGIPLADAVVGMDTEDTLVDGGPGPAAFDGLLHAWVISQTLAFGAVLWVVSSGGLTPLEWVGLTLSTALVSVGGGINVAHELMHRTDKLHRAEAEWLMTLACYTHFCVEHVLGHHRRVATAEDPASSRRGESLYAFLPRTVVGGLVSAWHIETERTARRGIGPWSLRNRRFRYALDLGVLSTVIAVAFGPVALVFFWVQGVLAFSLLEVINYVEHYGLARKQLATGRYERVRPQHSWNANHLVSNGWLFNLQRHADHHANASRPYYKLRAIEDGPQLPFSYPMAILVALVPPLWMRIMDPLLDEVGAQSPEVA